MVVGHTGELNFQCPHIELNALAGGTRKEHPGATIVPILLSMDKTLLTTF